MILMWMLDIQIMIYIILFQNLLNIKKKNFKGAARMKTRSPEELKNDEASSLLVEAQAFEFDA